jgi:hypothetical protein
MDTYQVIAEWIGWPPIVIVMLILGGIWFRFFRQQLTIEKEKYDLVEKKLKDCREQTSVVLITELAETRKRLQEEIEYLYGQSKFDNEKILALENQLQETNLKLEEQREFIEGAQDILDELVLPREGKLNGEVEGDIQKTIKEQSCIYIPVGPYWHDVKINIDDLKSNEPFTLEVVFPGMSKMYLFFYDKFNKHIGIVANPYVGIYEKDYYVTLLHFLNFIPFERVDDQVQYEGEARILRNSSFHAVSPIDPKIFYIKIPFDENQINRLG